MNDLISRQAAIEAVGINTWAGFRLKDLPSAQPDLDEWCMDCKEYDQERHCCPRWNRVIRNTVEEIKNTQPERKRGTWIMHIDDLFPAESTMECNQCHEHQPVTIDDNFCPNCGADMREEAEDALD